MCGLLFQYGSSYPCGLLFHSIPIWVVVPMWATVSFHSNMVPHTHVGCCFILFQYGSSYPCGLLFHFIPIWVLVPIWATVSFHSNMVPHTHVGYCFIPFECFLVPMWAAVSFHSNELLCVVLSHYPSLYVTHVPANCPIESSHNMCVLCFPVCLQVLLAIGSPEGE